MTTHDNIQLEMEEPILIRVEEAASTKKIGVCLWLKRLFNFDDVPNEKHHHPIFIIVMCILHVFIHLLTYINISWNGQDFAFSLFNLCKFFVPCMRPTSHDTRIRIFNCGPSMENVACYDDDLLKNMCFSFMYPHQLWRMITVNLMHLSLLHLLVNLFYQCLYGILLERKYGSVRVILIYWLSNLGAALSFMLKDTEKPAVGASGAVYGLFLFLIMDRLIAMQTNPGRRLFILMQLTLVVLLPFLISKPLIFIVKFKAAHSAHFGGGLVGFLCSICMLGCPCPWNNEHCISRTACQRIAFVFLSLYYIITLTIFFLIDTPIVGSILYKF